MSARHNATRRRTTARATAPRRAAMAPRGGGADAGGAPGSSFPAWAKSVDAVEKHYGVTSAQGLSSPQVAAQRARWGFNELDKEEPTPLWKLVLEQFDDPLVKVRARCARTRQRLRTGGFATAHAARQWRAPCCPALDAQRPGCAHRTTPTHLCVPRGECTATDAGARRRERRSCSSRRPSPLASATRRRRRTRTSCPSSSSPASSSSSWCSTPPWACGWRVRAQGGGGSGAAAATLPESARAEGSASVGRASADASLRARRRATRRARWTR